jgi:4a-hydroxytetrahydrobiopterin dehydratase
MAQCKLAKKKCVPCQGGVPALKGEGVTTLLNQLDAWNVADEHHLTKTYKFPDFVTALRFVNQIGDVAEREGHHPNIYFTWGTVRVEIFTHKVNGLTESDFILAAKIDELPRE